MARSAPYHSPFFIAETAKSPARRAPHPRVNSRRRMLCPQQFVAYVFEDVSSSLDPDFARENGVLILDAEDAFVADVHVGHDDGLPNAGAVTIADGAKSFRSLVEVASFKSEIEDAILVDVLRKEDRVFHVGMEECALLAEKMDDLDGIAALPEEMAEIAVRANLLADSFAKFHQRARIVNHKIRSHFKGEPGDAVSTREGRRFLPIRNHLFFPLPVLHPSILGGPAIRDPVGLGIQRRSARAAGKANNNFHAEHLREEDGLAEGGNVFLGVPGFRVKRVAMATERGDANTAIFKFFLPSCGFAAVAQELVEGTMMIIGIATGANLHGFKTQRANFIEHGIEREMLVNRVENADRNLPQRARGRPRGKARSKCRCVDHAGYGCSARDGGSQQAARSRKKLSPVERRTFALFLHAGLLEKQSDSTSGSISAALYAGVTAKQGARSCPRKHAVDGSGNTAREAGGATRLLKRKKARSSISEVSIRRERGWRSGR